MAERRIIQIAVVTDGDISRREDRLYALADDGTVWTNAYAPTIWDGGRPENWIQWPALPQPEPETANG